ncbi:MAG TPA: ABC transporter substrate-binding protein [Herpetosiphonaceae bacterium]|nr:ABC transporter substrate-binding protein [Herpetosiphonaceae bacterium]
MKHRSTVGSRRLGLVLRLAAMLGLLAGCGASQTPGATTAPTQTSVQLSWFHTIEFVGFYEAIRQNYYKDANLDLRLDVGGFDSAGAYIDPVGQVVAGKADFGVAGADVILKARSEGQPVVALAAIYQRSPVALISLADKKIARPQDLIGKKIAVQPANSTVGIAYEALLTSQKIKHTDLDETERTDYDTVNALFDNQVDVLSGFITNDGMKAKQRSDAVNFILISDYGIDIYSNVIFTSEATIKDRPQLVEAFVKATVRGIQWAVDNPEKASTNVVDLYGQQMSPDIKSTQQPGLLASIPLLNPAGSRPGQMKDNLWEQAHQILLDQGIIKQPIDIKSAYTLAFVDKAYQP